MKKYAALLVFALATLASAQTSFTNGAALCSYNQTYHSRYCSSGPLFENGTQVGWIGVWFTLKADNTFTAGEVLITHADGGTVTYNDFAGSFTGSFTGTNMYGVLSGTFNGGGSSASETFTTVRGNCYKGTCGQRQEISSGSGVE
jgi:hypothetical protein